MCISRGAVPTQGDHRVTVERKSKSRKRKRELSKESHGKQEHEAAPAPPRHGHGGGDDGSCGSRMGQGRPLHGLQDRRGNNWQPPHDLCFDCFVVINF